MVGLQFPLPFPYFHYASILFRSRPELRSVQNSNPQYSRRSVAQPTPVTVRSTEYTPHSTAIKQEVKSELKTHDPSNHRRGIAMVQNSSIPSPIHRTPPDPTSINTPSRFEIPPGYISLFYDCTTSSSSSHRLTSRSKTEHTAEAANDLIRPTETSPNLVSDAAGQPLANSNAVSRCSGWADTAGKGENGAQGRLRFHTV